ncbi:MAG TPA: DUF542 domain-containing protein [Longimicrobiales bacterium]
MNSETLLPIDATQTVNDIIAAHPTTVSVFDAWGVDSCCGGHLPLATVAEKHRFDLARLLAELRAA